MRKSSFLFIVLFVCLGSFSGNGLSEPIKMGYFELKPHMYRSSETGQAAGAAITYVDTLARKAGYEVEWIGPLPFSRMMAMLQTGEGLDGTPLMSKNGPREKFLYYMTKPFCLVRPNLMVRRDYPLDRITSPNDLNGMVIGQFKKAANSRFIMDNLSIFKFDKLSTGNNLFAQQLRKLISGRIDAIHTLDEYTLTYEAIRLNLEPKVKLLMLPEDPWPFYTVFCRTEKGKKILERFNRAFEQSKFSKEKYTQMIRDEFKTVRLQRVSS